MKFKTFRIGVVAALGLAALAGAAHAQADRQPAATLDELLQRIQQDSAEANQAMQERLADFEQARNQQQVLLSQAQGELNALLGESAALTAQADAIQAQIAELDEQLRVAQGEFGELFGVARQTAGEFATLVRGSAVSAQYPGRHRVLEQLSESTALPTRQELDAIWQVMLHEMIQQGRVVTFERPVTNLAEGQALPVTRIGSFVIFAEANGAAHFLRYNGEQNLLSTIDRQPPGRFLSAAQRVANAEPGEIVRGPLDPSLGSLLQIQRDIPTFRERVSYGGNIGYFTITLASIGVIFGLFRLVVLTMTSMSVRAQAGNTARPKKGNPLGRVLLVYEEHKNDPIETIELKLDEQILRESSRLEFGLSLLKLIAAVGPLLGLLGTVTGMIGTFQAITLFGTGDPQRMAGGISEALVTTVIGLCTAIPLLILHAFCASAARSSQQILDEQAAGMVAERAERATATA